MAGAFSLFLGLLGLGAAGAVSAGQNAKFKKADYQYGEEHGLHGTSEVLQMRERVRKEWWSICGKTYNACERPASSYGDLSRPPWCYLKKRWFIDHLNKKGIPYDDLVVDDVTGVTFYDHENGDYVLGQDYFESREKAEEFKRISDRAYGKLLGEGQTRITTVIIER